MERFRAPVLLSGTKAAILIDGGWTFRNGREIAEVIRATGKTLTTIFISDSNPDYYFNLRPIVSRFPQTRVLAAPTTIEAIQASAQTKIDTWRLQLKENGPRDLTDIVTPEPYLDSILTLEGNEIEIVSSEGLIDNRYLYVPTLNAVIGGNLLFSGIHVWTANTPTTEQRKAWIAELEKLAARNPKIVVPGHVTLNARLDASAIVFTRQYLLDFEEECARSDGSEGLIAAMSQRYPKAEMRVALAIGAKVAKGETLWR